MNLLPLEIVLGLQVAAALVIFLELLADRQEDQVVAREENRTSARSSEDRMP